MGKVTIDEETLDEIGQAIIDKGGATAPMKPGEMAGKIAEIGGTDEAPPGGWINDGNWHFWIRYSAGTEQRRLLRNTYSSMPNYTAHLDWYRDNSLYLSRDVQNSKLGIAQPVIAQADDEMDRIDIITEDMPDFRSGTYTSYSALEFGDRDVKLVFAEIGKSFVGSLGYSLYGHENLRAVKFASQSVMTATGESMMRYCRTIRNVVLPDSVETIGNYAFSECNGIAEFRLPPSCTSLGSFAFHNTTSMFRFDAHDSQLEEIGQFAFQNSKIFYADFPSTLRHIAVNAFLYSGDGESASTRYLIFRSVVPPVCDDVPYIYNHSKIYVPAESVDAYKTATNWSNWSSKIEAIPEELI